MIDIKDISNNIRYSTPVNQGGKRKYTLMKEDYITLKFSVANPIYFKLGDSIDNEIGLFELVDLQKPTYNETTAAYDYELRLDAYYWKWKNKKIFYSPQTGSSEAGWNLTATLEIHLGVFLRNLEVLGYTFKGTPFSYSIDSTVEKSPKLVQYDNMNLIDALTKMAEAWGCEWWIIGSEIHFGRCEHGEAINFELNTNVGAMSRSDSKTNYATRIYAFGAEKNIPTTYRKTLAFDAKVDGRFMYDEKRKVESSFFPESSKITPIPIESDLTKSYETFTGKIQLESSIDCDSPAGMYTFDLTELEIKSASRNRGDGDVFLPANVNIDIAIRSYYKPTAEFVRFIVKSLKDVTITTAGNGWTSLDTKEFFDLNLEHSFSFASIDLDIYNLDGSPYLGRLDVSCKGRSLVWTERIRHNTSVQFLSGANKDKSYDCLFFSDVSGRKNIIQIPENVTVSTGDTYTIENIIKSTIPAIYFSKPNTESTVEGVVTTRLMLPIGTDYVDAYPNMSQEECVEEVVIFEEVYPHRVGVLSTVNTHPYETIIEEDRKDPVTEKWDAYRFKDSEFIFSADYVLPGQELRIKFQSGALNGLDFQVWFNPYDKNKGESQKPEKNVDGSWNLDAQLFEIVRNEDYGRHLPDIMAVPRGKEYDKQGGLTYEGDKYVLYGFDPEFVLNNMIPTAEADLLKRAKEYVEKSKVDPSVFDCKMLPSYMHNNGEGKTLEIGTKVNLINKAYFESGRQSRIIGYEYPLDKPYDNPIYTVGETVAYSRIAALEEKIESLTYKGQTYSSGSSGGGGSSSGGSSIDNGLSKDIRVNAPKTGHIDTGSLLKKGLTYEQIFRTILYKPEPATFLGKISTSNDVEIGSTRGTLTYIANKHDNGLLIEGYYMNNEEKILLEFSEPDVKGDTNATRSLIGHIEKNETYKAFADFEANGDDNLPALSLTSTITVNARRKWFAGTASAIPTNSITVRSLPTSGFIMATSFRFGVQRGVKRVVFCFPVGYTLTKLVYDGVISGIVVPVGQLKVSTINEVFGANAQLPIAYTCCVIENDIENLQDATDYYTVNLTKS